MKPCRATIVGLVMVLAAWAGGAVIAQPVSPADHAKHHPGQDKGGAAGMPPGGMPKGKDGAAGMAPGGKDAGMGGGMEGMMGGGMEDMMDGMMKKMGVPPPKDIYPSLMSLPELTPEQREQLRAQAQERMRSGVALLSEGLDRLAKATEAEDYAAMQEATGQVREGLARFESGVAAQRALSEGKPPKQVALQWFKSEMNLQPPQGVEPRGGSSGRSVLHSFAMVLLVAFAVAMLAMYYFKMRRAATLFGRLDLDSKSSPPGSPPPKEGGGPAPPTGDNEPPGGKGPPPGGKEPPSGGKGATTEGKEPLEPPQVGKDPPELSADGKESPPLTAKWRGQLVIDRITPETPNIRTFRLRSPGGGPLPFTFVPGQFLNVALSIGGARMNRSYSISSSPNEREYVELSVKREERGAVSRHIVDLWKVGTVIEANGPVGKFTFNGTEADSVVLISAGVGVTPMMSIARYLSERSWPGDVFFIFTCRYPADFLFENALAELASRNPKLHVVVAMTKPGPDWTGPRGRLTKELLAKSVPDIASRRVHICGPLTMMEATKAILRELGVADDHVKAEAFGAVKPPLAEPGAPAVPRAAETGLAVTFSTNNKTANIRAGQTILELSEELAIGIENSCRVGTCGICKVKMTSGEVEMAVQDSLDEDDKANGLILACQAKPKTAVTVEA